MCRRPLPMTGLLAALAAGCAVNDKPADLPLPPRDRMAYDAETTMQMAVASRLEGERRALVAALAPSPAGPTTRPAVVEVPAPQLIPAPTAAGRPLDQGPSAAPLKEALATVADANEHATRSPTPEGFLNAVQFYDYAPGVRYNAVTAAGYITSVRLRPGERLQSLSCSDTAAYDIDQVAEGAGPTATTLILVKPKRANTQSNWVLTTDERTYLVDVYVGDGANYQSEVAWHYPHDGLRVFGERREQGRLAFEKGGAVNALAAAGSVLAAAPADSDAGDAGGPAVGPLGMNLADLNFDYALLYQRRGRDGKTKDAPPPPWAPLRVFDDGRKTFVQFPPQARGYELPPLFALDHPDARQADLVNYRRSGDFLVLDRLVVAAEMRAGEAPQQVVKIVRGRATDPAARSTAPPDPQATARPSGGEAPRRRPRPGGPPAMNDHLNGTHHELNGTPHEANGRMPPTDSAVDVDAGLPTDGKGPARDAHGREQHDTFGGEAGVRRLRAGRIAVVAAAVATVGCLALGYGLTPPRRDDRPSAVKIDVRKQQGDLPTPPGLAPPADLNYATETRPPKPAAPPPLGPPGSAAAAPPPDGRGNPLASPSAPASNDDGERDALRRRYAELEKSLAEARSQLDDQVKRAQRDAQAERDRVQASLDAPIGFKLDPPTAATPPLAGTNGPRTPQLPSDARPSDSDLDGLLNPLVVAPSGDAALNPNEVQPRGVRSNLQTEKIAFLNSAERGLDTYLRTGPTGPVAVQSELSAGTVIPGFTVTALNSDLPGKVVGRVSADVYDSATGRHVLVPQGSVAVGDYSSLVSNGQNRLLIAWEMLTFPDGRSVDLQRQPGIDGAGASGLADRVDYHFDKLLLAGGVSTAVAVGGQVAEGGNSGFGQTESVEEQLREMVFGGASDTASRVADKVIDRQLDVQPTITVRPGWRLNILLTRNLVLEPYADSRR